MYSPVFMRVLCKRRRTLFLFSSDFCWFFDKITVDNKE